MELKDVPGDARATVERTRNPFNGIERRDILRVRGYAREFGIHSMELKGLSAFLFKPLIVF